MAKAKAFRWKGPGVLWIRTDAVSAKVIPPKGKESVVRDQLLLEAVGAEQIEKLVASGKAEYVNLVEEVLHTVPEISESERKETKEAESRIGESAKATETVRKTAEDTAKRDKQEAKPHEAGIQPSAEDRARSANKGEPEGVGPKK